MATFTDRRWSHNEPTDFLDMRAKVALAQYRFAPSSAWEVDMALRWFKNQEHQIYHEPMGLIDRDHDGTAEWMTRQLRNQYRNNDAIASNVNAIFRTSTGAIDHKLLIGADYYRLDADFRAQTANTADSGRVRGPVPGIDLFNPVYGRSGFYDYGLDALPWRATSTRSQRDGAYLQDELTLTPRWYAMAGLRWDGFKDDNLLSGSRVTGNDLSWRVGSTVVLRDGINAYASYASGFLPQDAANQDSSVGGPFAPERSTQWEVGLKTALNDGGLTLNTALYRIERSNIVQANGRVVDGVNQLSALGLVRSEGMEVDLLADLTERWVLNLTYAYNDARVLDAGTDGITNASGDRFANAPRNTFGLWTRYDLPMWRSAIAFGADFVGERVSLMANASNRMPFTTSAGRRSGTRGSCRSTSRTCSTRCMRRAVSIRAPGTSPASHVAFTRSWRTASDQRAAGMWHATGKLGYQRTQRIAHAAATCSKCMLLVFGRETASDPALPTACATSRRTGAHRGVELRNCSLQDTSSADDSVRNVMLVSKAASKDRKYNLGCSNVMNLRRIARLRMGWNLTFGGTH